MKDIADSVYTEGKLSELLGQTGFNSAIKWSAGDETKYEAGVGAWAEASKLCTFARGKEQVGRVQDSGGMLGRILENGAHEWCSNVQNLPIDKFLRLESSKLLGIKTVLCISVNNGFVELASVDEKVEDSSVIHMIKEMF